MVMFSYCGPSGGSGGDTFSDGLIWGRNIAEVRIHSGACIDSIQVVYIDESSNEIVNPKYGGSGGTLSALKLIPGEYITTIGGKYGHLVDSLWIKTNKGRTQKWGGDGGYVAFNYSAPPGTSIYGFCGQAGHFLDAIGVIIKTP